MTMRFRLLSAVLWTIVILILCWTPEIYLPVEEVPGSLGKIIPLDKVVHAGIFAVFAILWLRGFLQEATGSSGSAWPESRSRPSRRSSRTCRSSIGTANSRTRSPTSWAY